MPNENPNDAAEQNAANPAETPAAVTAAPTSPSEPAPAASAAPTPAVGGGFVPEPVTEAFPIESFGDGSQSQPFAGIELLDDVDLDVKIELGRTEMYIEDVLKLGVGSVVELDRLAGDPVDIYVNERLVARGEVLILNDNFCVRVNDIINPLPELDVQR